MADGDVFEVQRLLTEGDRAGHWEVEPSGPPSFAGANIAKAFAAEVRRIEQRPLRTVPFGTGPNGRPGDVTPDGNILAAPGQGVPAGHALAGGTVFVDREQAENAALFGWVFAGGALGREPGTGFVQICRDGRDPYTRADVTAGGGC